MSISEKLTNIIKSKGLTRREFAQKLIDLSPKVNRVGETPTLPTIYGYLNGRINIPVDLISFIAEALDISEQELFDTSLITKRKFFHYITENSSAIELNYYQKVLSSKLLLDVKNLDEYTLNSLENQDRAKVEEIVKNIKFAPSPFIDKILQSLNKYKKLTDEFNE